MHFYLLFKLTRFYLDAALSHIRDQVDLLCHCVTYQQLPSLSSSYRTQWSHLRHLGSALLFRASLTHISSVEAGVWKAFLQKEQTENSFGFAGRMVSFAMIYLCLRGSEAAMGSKRMVAAFQGNSFYKTRQ